MAIFQLLLISSGMSDTMVKKSLRNDNAFDKSSLNARTPLPYEHLRVMMPYLQKKYGESLIFVKK